MRKTIAVVSTAAALLIGGAGVANAEFTRAGAPASTASTVAQDNYGTNNDNNNGLWGLAGLLGLFGLLGLRRNHDHDTHRADTRPQAADTGTLVAGHRPSETSGTSSPTAPRSTQGSTPPPTI